MIVLKKTRSKVECMLGRYQRITYSKSHITYIRSVFHNAIDVLWLGKNNAQYIAKSTEHVLVQGGTFKDILSLEFDRKIKVHEKNKR